MESRRELLEYYYSYKKEKVKYFNTFYIRVRQYWYPKEEAIRHDLIPYRWSASYKAAKCFIEDDSVL